VLYPLNPIEITEVAVLTALKKLNPTKSPGPDGLHPRLLRECAEELAHPLAKIFQGSLNEGKLLNEWKDANVTPVFKKGTRTDALNYRPISLTSICCKVLEKIVREAILQHMTRNDFLSDSQHGFVSGRSCTTQLLRVVDKWSEVLDRGGALDAIYLDFAKAFDSSLIKGYLFYLL
jgi:Reverse transcriptase (RNA-dependent DNA polymerase)